MVKIALFVILLVWGCLILGIPCYYLSIGYIDASDPVRWPVFGGYLGFLVFASGIPALLGAGALLNEIRRSRPTPYEYPAGFWDL